MDNKINVYLYKVGRNLNRAYRTCEAFGVESIKCFDCKDNDVDILGNLYKATNRVSVEKTKVLPPYESTLVIETCFDTPIWEIDWDKIDNIVIGGETSGVNTKLFKSKYSASIPMMGMVSGLTVEAALAIALYERSSYLLTDKLLDGKKIDEFQAKILTIVASPISKKDIVKLTGYSTTLTSVFLRNLIRMNLITVKNKLYERI